jgi:hypothetical protein
LKAIEVKGDNIKIQIKKDAEGFKEISGAAFKKAKKTFAEQQKKAKKLLEQQKKQEEELKKKLEDEAKALEHAKSIVLTEDASLPPAKKVNNQDMMLIKTYPVYIYRSKSVNLLNAEVSVSRSLVGSIVFVFKVKT